MPSYYVHAVVFRNIQMRAGSVRSIGLGESKRGRRVCCMIMSSGVVGMNGNNRASLCYSPCPSCTQRASKLFPIAFSPNPHHLPPSPKKKPLFSFPQTPLALLPPHRQLVLILCSLATGFSFVHVCKRQHSQACCWSLCGMHSKPFYTVCDPVRLPYSLWRLKQVIDIVKGFGSTDSTSIVCNP